MSWILSALDLNQIRLAIDYRKQIKAVISGATDVAHVAVEEVAVDVL